MSAEHNERKELSKSLGTGAVWAVAVGSIIGWGCFIKGVEWTGKAGGTLPLMLGFMVGALLMIIVGYSYSYMIAKFPVAGGEFAYAYKGFGTKAAFICGWMLSLGYLAIVALNATALPLLVGHVFGDVIHIGGVLYTVAGQDVYAAQIIIPVFFIVLFGVMNYRGVKSVGSVQLAMVLIMCGAVALSIIGTAVTGNFHVENLQPLSGAVVEGKEISFGAGFVSILALAPFLYVGFDCIPQAAEEYNFPPSKAKMLICSALVVGGLIYAGMALVTDAVIPWQELLEANYGWPTGAVLEMAMGKIGVGMVAIAVCMGIFTGMNGFFMTSSRLLFGMARAKMLPAAFEKIHEKHDTPSVCVLFTLIVCCVCPFFGRKVIDWVVEMCSVGTAFGYFFTCAGAYIMLKNTDTSKDENVIHPIVALMGCAISLGIFLLLVVPGSPAFMATPSWIALGGWVLMGFVFYMVSKKSFVNIPKVEMDYLILGDYSSANAEELAELKDNLLPEKVILHGVESVRVRKIIPPTPVAGRLVIDTTKKDKKN